MMKKYLTCFIAVLALAMPFMAISDEPQWLDGVYTGRTDENDIDLTFCAAGEAYFIGIRATYVVTGKEDDRVVKLYSNGMFTLKVADHGNTLVPMDEFTKTWLSKNPLKRDPNEKYHCNFPVSSADKK